MKRFLPMCEIVAVASGSEQYFQEMAEQFKDIPSVDKAKRIFFLLANNKNKKMKLVTSSVLTRSMLSLLDRSQRFVYRLASTYPTPVMYRTVGEAPFAPIPGAPIA